MNWQVFEGSDFISVTLFEASDTVDSGEIYLQRHITLSGDEFVGELGTLQAKATNDLCKTFISEYPEILDSARLQTGEPTYYPKRSPKYSKLNPDQTIRS